MSTSNGDFKARLTSVKEDVMTGVSFMIPFVTIGGIFLALAFAWAATPFSSVTVENMFEPAAQGTLAWFLSQMGGLGLTIMIPVLGGYIAYAIADRPGLAPGFLLSYLIQQGTVLAEANKVLGLPAGDGGAAAGFLGAIIAGLLAGYVALWLKQRNVPSAIKPMMPVLIIPVATVAILLPVMLFVVGVPVALANAELTSMLEGMESTAGSGSLLPAAALGALLGGMMAFDMGGPVNKVAYLFSVGLLSEGIYGPMSVVMIAGMTPPLGMALSNFLAEHKYPDEMYENAKSATVMGFSFITEGAIPYAASDPLRVIPSLVAGSATAGALAMASGVEMLAPHGGVFVIPLAKGGGPIPGPLAFLGCIAVGAVVTAVMVTLLKPDHAPEMNAEPTTAD